MKILKFAPGRGPTCITLVGILQYLATRDILLHLPYYFTNCNGLIQSYSAKYANTRGEKNAYEYKSCAVSEPSPYPGTGKI